MDKEVKNTLKTMFENAKVSKPTLYSLPPCFCGGKAKFETWEIGGEVFYQAVCDKCGQYTDWYGTIEEASVAWQDLQSDVDKSVNGS